jgi:ankyrin repeat protein
MQINELCFKYIVKVLIGNGTIDGLDMMRKLCETYTVDKRDLVEHLVTNVYKNDLPGLLRGTHHFTYADGLTYSDLIRMAILAGFDPNYQYDDGRTILHIVTRMSDVDLEIVRLLCSYMIDIDVCDNDGCTPWPEAEGYGGPVEEEEKYVSLSKIFLSYGASSSAGSHDKTTSLLSLRIVDTVDIIRDICSTRDINDGDDRGKTMLHHAVVNSHIRVVTELVRLGANIDTTDRGGDTPLHTAACGHNITYVEELIRLGAKVNTQNKYGHTPLHIAASVGDMETSHYLIKNGANAIIQDNDGRTPLHLVASWGKHDRINIEFLNSLITLESWFIKDKYGDTFLDVAGPRYASQFLSKALQIDPSLRVFKECIASLSYKERKRVRELLLVLKRSPIPATLFPLVISDTFEEYVSRENYDEE